MAGRLKIGLLGALCLHLGCGVVKRDKSKIVNNSKRKFEVMLKKSADSSRKDSMSSFLLQKDTLGIEYMLEVWPTGPFSFSPYKGFEGSALKIRYFGREKRETDLALQMQSSKAESGKTQTTFSVKDKVKQDLSEVHVEVKRSSFWRWWLAATALIAGLVIFKFYRKWLG